jgi:pimeloyl-ACP methyl ester carboxylesterase
MNEVGLHAADVLGTSHGGGVAVLMASTEPRRIKKLILVAPVNPWSKHGQWITKLLATKFGRLAFEKLTPALQATGKVWLSRLYADPQKIAPGTLEGYRAPIALAGSWTYGLDIVKHWHSDLRVLAEAYGKVSQPTLLMWGDKDLAVYASSAQDVRKRIPHAELKLLSGVGHMPYEEVPGEFNRVVMQFLQ